VEHPEPYGADTILGNAGIHRHAGAGYASVRRQGWAKTRADRKKPGKQFTLAAARAEPPTTQPWSATVAGNVLRA